jgi:hypothetical protein
MTHEEGKHTEESKVTSEAIENGVNGEKESESVPPATLVQKLGIVFLLVIFTTIPLYLGYVEFRRVEGKLQAEITVPLHVSSDLILNAGPSSFWYDKDAKRLHHRGPIDDKRKKELLSLIPSELVKDGDTQKQAVHGYSEAIDMLAYKSNKSTETFIVSLLILGGLSGWLGVQLRSISNFIGVACYKNELDVNRWWPWYVVRPVSGFLLGAVMVLIIDAGLFQAAEMNLTRTSWWIGAAFLAGFGANEFTERLRDVSRTLFGQSSGTERSATRKMA